MPAAQTPKQQPPMEAIATDGAAASRSTRGRIIATQPNSEPRPQYDTDVSIRGGGINLGCTCCDGSCSFHKACC
ncbi:hypothetical protein B0T22DRAFT_449111 [Podospora appendiculata]|uniref:Uncharacterized protein n=1 Tax=Podospora appendiculata TaxID=314037 RepID=A0AAE0XGS2_9PEZI|nr:hypothetical protein B0T22DRAFT_449111 [Podospora appendiculata]